MYCYVSGVSYKERLPKVGHMPEFNNNQGNQWQSQVMARGHDASKTCTNWCRITLIKPYINAFSPKHTSNIIYYHHVFTAPLQSILGRQGTLKAIIPREYLTVEAQTWSSGKGVGCSRMRIVVDPYPYHPCMVYLPTLTIKIKPNVGKVCHTWMVWVRCSCGVRFLFCLDGIDFWI